MTDAPLRVCIRACVTDIPGDKYARSTRLAQDFSEQVRKRPFNNNYKAECHDAEHILPGFDSDNPVNAWFVIDFNVTQPLEQKDVLALPHEVYLASRQGDSWVFIPRRSSVEKAKDIAKGYKWGANFLKS